MAANKTIVALNWLNNPNSCPEPVTKALPSSQVSRVHTYLIKCSLEFSATPVSASHTPSKENEKETKENENDCGYDVDAAAIPIQAGLLSLPVMGGTFDAEAYLGSDLAGFLRSEPAAMYSAMVGDIAAAGLRSFQSATPQEYVKTVARLLSADMVELSQVGTSDPVGLFAVWKTEGETQRLIIDARPSNVRFKTPPYEHTGGDDLTRIQVKPNSTLEVAKTDLADYFHTIRLPEPTRQHFVMRPICAKRLRACGVDVPDDAIAADGMTHPRITTVPMGWKAAPSVAQSAHEAVLYGEKGEGSQKARMMNPVLDTSARLSSSRTPEDTSRAHAIVIDDLLMFRQVAEEEEATASKSSSLDAVLKRYEAVSMRIKPSKVHDYSSKQVVLGYQLDNNVLRATQERYAGIRAAVEELRRGWAKPREVERLIGKFTHMALLNRLSLSVFSAVYAFARKVGHRYARVWPSVMRELEHALSLVPLMRADLSRPVSPVLIQTDACDHGEGVVYTTDVPLEKLQNECQRSRTCGKEDWSVEQSLSAAFEAPLDPKSYKVAIKHTYPLDSPLRYRHINAKEVSAVGKAIRWACRAPRTRGCRLVVQSDSSVGVGALRKGRSSKPSLLRELRRIAAYILAEDLGLHIRWIATDKNMADNPSRGARTPGPCISTVRPRGKGQGGYAGQRVGQAKKPGPPPAHYWGPLFDANVNSTTSQSRYAPAVRVFLDFVLLHGDDFNCKDDADYWLCYYMHHEFTKGATSRGTRKGHCNLVLYGLEHFYPAFKPLTQARRCMKGWEKLQPPQPAAPMPADLAYALAAIMVLLKEYRVALALLLSTDCWLRISEVAGLKGADIVDHRAQADPVGRGVAVYLERTKTGRHQAVMVADPDIAELLVQWSDNCMRSGDADSSLFPSVGHLRATLKQALSGVGIQDEDTRGFGFTWHSCRHGGASRAYQRGDPIADILTRGRWKAESSGRHYIQSGRQLLLGISLPVLVHQIATKLRSIGLITLSSPHFERLLEA